MGGYLNSTGKVFLGTTAIAALGSFLAGRGSKTDTHEYRQERSDEDRSSNRAWSAAIVLIVVALAVGALVGIGWASYRLTRYIIARRRAGALLKSRASLAAGREAQGARRSEKIINERV